MLPGLPLNLTLPGFSTGPAVSGATSNAGLSTPIISPFTFDSSNWQIQVKSSGNQNATSSAGADVKASGGTGGTGGTGGGQLDGYGGGFDFRLVLLGLGAWFFLR